MREAWRRSATGTGAAWDGADAGGGTGDQRRSGRSAVGGRRGETGSCQVKASCGSRPGPPRWVREEGEGRRYSQGEAPGWRQTREAPRVCGAVGGGTEGGSRAPCAWRVSPDSSVHPPAATFPEMQMAIPDERKKYDDRVSTTSDYSRQSAEALAASVTRSPSRSRGPTTEWVARSHVSEGDSGGW